MSLLSVPSIPFPHFLITCCRTDATYCLTDATDWNQSHAELKKELLQCCCNPAWMERGWLIPWNVTLDLPNFQDLLSDEKTSHERRFGEPFSWPINAFRVDDRESSDLCQRPINTPPVW